MISGFGLVESGMVAKKNEANIMIKNAIDVILGGLSFWMFGFAIIQGNEPGTNAFFGVGRFFTEADESEMGDVFSHFLFQASFATTATTIVSGAVAERMNLKAYMVFAFTNTVTYCFPAHWVWGPKGWLKGLGVVDMGGASPVHLVGGVAGLIGTLMLKPRVNRFQNVCNAGAWKHKMSSPTNVILGMFMLWWGWLGFNCGSTFGVSGGKWKLASRSAVCTINASCGGGVFVTVYSYVVYKRLDIPLFMAGILGSLVSITAICGVVRPGESLAIGFLGAAVAVLGWQLMEKFKIDDPVGAVSTHAGCSIWGMIAVGLFVELDQLEKTFSNSYGLFKGGKMRVLGVQLLACVSITAWTVILVYIQFKIIDKAIGLRLPLEEEILGADICEHAIDCLANQSGSAANIVREPASNPAPEPAILRDTQRSGTGDTQPRSHSENENNEKMVEPENPQDMGNELTPSTQSIHLSSKINMTPKKPTDIEIVVNSGDDFSSGN